MWKKINILINHSNWNFRIFRWSVSNKIKISKTVGVGMSKHVIWRPVRPKKRRMTEYWCVRGTTQTKTFRNSPVNATKTKMHTSYHFPFLHSSIQHSFLIFTNKTRSFTGLDTFKGEIIHSHDYKTLTGYEDKRIVVIGIGNSGGDAAVELSRVAKQVVHLNPRHSALWKNFCLLFI